MNHYAEEPNMVGTLSWALRLSYRAQSHYIGNSSMVSLLAAFFDGIDQHFVEVMTS